MIETGQIRQELVQDVGGLLIGTLTAELHLQMPQFGRRAMRKESSHRRRGGGMTANAGFEPGRMNAQMSKHRIDPPAAMVLDGAKAAAAGARPDFRNQGTNLIVGNFRLDLPDQVLTVVMGETKVGFRRQLGTFDEAHHRRVQITSLVNPLDLQRPFQREPLYQEFPERYSPFLNRPPTSFQSRSTCKRYP